ncbi:MAG: hypothetical protein ABI887_07485, partial [Burkholderiales bacterium]
WRVTTDPTSLLGSVAWAATLPSVADVCKPTGSSHVYARDFGTASTTLRNTDNTAREYFPLDGNVTDLHYLSVDGKARLVGGTDLADRDHRDPTLIPTSAMSSLPLRRLNWRELQMVE